MATLAGVLSGVVLFVWAITRGGSLLDFLHVPSLAITLGGLFAATLINYPLQQVLGVLKVARHAFVRRPSNPDRLISLLTSFAERARREGILALEEAVDQLDEPYIRRGLQLAVDGTDPALIRSILENELASLEERHRQGAHIFETMAQLAPAFGLIGTLIGLVQMLKLVADPTKVGPGMAVALLTAFYGVFLANFLFLPIAGKLKTRSAQEILEKELMLEGILAIYAGDSPRIVAEKLRSFLPPELRERAAAAGPAARRLALEPGEEE